MNARAKAVLRVVLLTATYVGAAELGLAFDAVGGFATLVWAPSGIALSALLLGGLELWPGVFMGAFITNSLSGAAPLVALAIAVGNTLEAVLSVHVLKRMRFRPALDSLRDLALLVGIAAFASTLVAATVGASSLLAGRVIEGEAYLATWRAWWLGDLIGDLLVAPLLLVWCAPRSVLRERRDFKEALGLVVLTLAGGLFVFAGPSATLLSAFRQPLLLSVPLMWAALRFGARGATGAAVILSVVAIYGTAHGLGPFVHERLHESLTHLQVFMGICTLTALVLSASVAERARAEASQQRHHQLLCAVTEGTTDAVFVKDLENRYVLINEAGARFLHRSPEEVIGKSDRELFQPETAEAVIKGDRAVMAAGSTCTYEELLVLNDGPHTFLSTKGACFDDEGRVIGLMGVCRDITERKHREESQRLLADLAPRLAESFDHEMPFDKIAALVVERTVAERCVFELVDVPGEASRPAPDAAPLAHVRSYRLEAHGRLFGRLRLESTLPFSAAAEELAQEIARRVSMAIESTHLYRLSCEAIRARDDFLSVASHELRTPLHALVINLSHVCATSSREPSKLEDIKSRIERAVRQTDRLTRLVDSLLDVSRVSTGELHLHREELDLAELTLEVCARFGDQVQLQGSNIAVAAEGPLLGHWDRLRLEQVLTNLLSNAVKYGGGQPIVVSLEDQGQSVRLSVADRGIGIPEDDLARVFERYQRAASARHYGGLGLGLFIARQIVDAHGGSITAESAPGQGTVFVVELPRNGHERELGVDTGHDLRRLMS
jgi:PAS domain S-box-containing protein